MSQCLRSTNDGATDLVGTPQQADLPLILPLSQQSNRPFELQLLLLPLDTFFRADCSPNAGCDEVSDLTVEDDAVHLVL